MPDNFQKQGLVVTSNELIHAKYHFTLWQKRVFMYFVSQIEKDAVEFGMQKVQIADLVRFFEAEQNGTVSSIIENVPRQLYETSIQVPYRDENGNERFGEVRLVTKYTKPQDKKAGNAYIELKFNEDLKPHLHDLKKQFSKYELRYIVHLQSAHAIRIYEILKSHQFRKQIDLDVDYLKLILEVDKKYKLYGDFKRKILDKSQADLDEHCDIGFTYQEIKSGKKVVTLRFTIFEKQPGERRAAAKKGGAEAKTAIPPATIDLSSLEPDAGQDALFLELQPVLLGEWGISPGKLINIIRAYPAEQIRQAMRVTARKAATGAVHSKAGFFIEAVQKNYTDEQELAIRRKVKQTATSSEKQAKTAQLKEKLEALLGSMRGEINATIRANVEMDESIRVNALESVKASKNPILKRELEKAGADISEQHFRENLRLREAVIWAIVEQNPEVFQPISTRFAPEVAGLMHELAALTGKKEVNFREKTFLGLT